MARSTPGSIQTVETDTSQDTTVVGITCTHDCQDACRTLVTVQGGIAIDIKADRSHPVTGRHLCVKVDNYLDRVYSPDRLTTPLRRTGPKGAVGDPTANFEPISWDEALTEIADRWKADIATSGGESILGYSYLGTMGVLAGFGTAQALFHRMGASRLGRTICGNPWKAVTALTGFVQTNVENIPDAKLVIVWGMDPVSKSIHTWDLIRKARKRGADMIVIDPYRSSTAKRADIHIRPHLGTDGALAMAMANVIIRDGLVDEEFVATRTSDFDQLAEAVADWTPERAETETGVPADDIVALAHRYATERPVSISIGVGMQRSFGAATAIRVIQCLPALTGQWRWAAGGISRSGSFAAFNQHALQRPDLQPGPTRELSMLHLGRHLNDKRLDPPIKSLYVWNANPAVIAPDQNEVLRGLARDDLFTVVHDQFLTDTARYADIVLPATTMIESDDLGGSWGYSYVSHNRAAIKPLGEAKSNTEVTRLLAAKMGFDEDIFQKSDEELMDLALSETDLGSLDDLKETGFQRIGEPIGTLVSADFAFSSTALADAGLPASVGYCPPSNAPDQDSADQDPADQDPADQDPADQNSALFPLRLLTLKRHHSINTSYGALPVLKLAEPEPTVELHPDDASARKISDGDRIRVFNQLGSVTCPVSITDATPAGTVAVPFGHWGVDGANQLTSDLLSDLGDGPTFCDNLVEVASL